MACRHQAVMFLFYKNVGFSAVNQSLRDSVKTKKIYNS